jgi:uncharacterized protein (DUF2225 family)
MLFKTKKINQKYMQKSKKDLAREELEKIYDNKFKWVQAGNALRNRLGDSLNTNPKFKCILRLSIIGNIGIWLTFISINF